MGKKTTRFGTRVLHSKSENYSTKSHNPPLHLTSSFAYENVQSSIEVFNGEKAGYVYSRYGNPNVHSIGNDIAELEGMDLDEPVRGLFTTNGMSAIYTTVNALVRDGGAIITQGDLYGGTTELLLKIVQSDIVQIDFTDLQQLEDVLKKRTDVQLIYLESPTNPTCSCIDTAAVVQLAQKYDVISVMDNTFSTPYLQRPMNHGIDFIIHSTTKYLNGHGTGLGGCIIGKENNAYWSKIWDTMKLIGSTGAPFDAWLVQQGLKTLKVRMDQHSSNAMSLASYLQDHTLVRKVNYPFLKNHPTYKHAIAYMKAGGGMLSFDVGSQENAIKVMDALSIPTQAPTLGDVDTLILHPRSSSHLKVDPKICESFGITKGLIRVSVGIEEIEDLMEDFERALTYI